MTKHLLVTNDFPPKVGGIQNYLLELWSRLDPNSFTVLTPSYPGAEAFDDSLDFEVLRSRHSWLGPYPWLPKQIRKICTDRDIQFVMYDPAWPLAFIAPSVGLSYGVVVHGAEAVVPKRLPLASQMFARAVKHSEIVVAASSYAATPVASLSDNVVVLPPGVDTERFKLPTDDDRKRLRANLGIREEFVISAVSRLVRRKGFAELIEAVGQVSKTHNVKLLIGGTGRESAALTKLGSEFSDSVKMLGRLSDEKVVELYQASDVMAMPCRTRWFGLEQEGFGIVFLEAAACGVPQIAAKSGGSHEAVLHNETGLVLGENASSGDIALAIKELIENPTKLRSLATASHRNAAKSSYELSATVLKQALSDVMLQADGKS